MLSAPPSHLAALARSQVFAPLPPVLELAALATLRPGAFAITVTHELPERLDFETVDSEILELDGCRTLVFISKKHPPGALGPPPGG